MDAEMKREVSDSQFDSPSSYLDTSIPEAVVNYDSEGKPLRGDRQTSVAEAIQITESVDEAFASNLRLLVKPKSSVVPKVIGVQYPELSETSQKSDGTLSESNALTVSLDTTTYTDRAVVTIENNRGFDVYLTALSIHGRRVIRYPDALINDKLKRDDDIRRNGEKVLQVANNYIVNGTQVDKIADFWFKYYQSRKHIYSITIKGTATWYEVGEWYQLSLGSADSVEYIDSTVECYSVQCERTAGGIGTTVCMFREVLEGWAKTTLYTARAILGGSPARRTARSNSVTVASSTFDGVYDYRCDGTDDDVQIQAAIDYVSTVYGGGTVELTQGRFVISHMIEMKNNITIAGRHSGTVITYSTTPYDDVYIFFDSDISGCELKDFVIDGEDYVHTSVSHSAVLAFSSASVVTNKIHEIEIKRIKSSHDLGIVAGIVSGSSSFTIYNSCIHDIAGVTNNTSAIGIAQAYSVESCVIENITKSGSGNGYGIMESKRCSKNKVQSCSTSSYYLSYADAGTSNACADTAAGGYNS